MQGLTVLFSDRQYTNTHSEHSGPSERSKSVLQHLYELFYIIQHHQPPLHREELSIRNGPQTRTLTLELAL